MSSFKSKSNYILNRNLLVSSKRKRLRHVDYILVRNLDLAGAEFFKDASRASANYSVWFTLHLTRASKAIYMSEKKYNTPSPKWNKIVFDGDQTAAGSNRHLAAKEFIVRVWFKFEEGTGSLATPKKPDEYAHQQSASSLKLLVEYELNLETVVQVNEEALNISHGVNSSNIIIVEMLDTAFSQPPPPPPGSSVVAAAPPPPPTNQPVPRPQSVAPRHQKTASLTGSARDSFVKNSYTLNSMRRINDYQRILSESALKIHQLKQASLVKYESTERQRELLVRKEAQLKRVQLYREQLVGVNTSISRLTIQNDAVDIAIAQQTRTMTERAEEEKAKLAKLNESIQSLMVKSANLNLKLKLRQKALLNELIGIFQLDTLFKTGPGAQTQQDTHVNLINAILRARSSTTANGSAKSALSMSNQIAIQLGYICHIIKMLTVILNIQLRYPVLFRASMSYIMEYEPHLTLPASQSESSSGALNAAATTSEFYEFIKEYPLFKPTSSSSSSKGKSSGSSLQEDISLYAIQLLNKDLLQLRIYLNNSRKSMQAQHPPQQSNVNNPPNAKISFRNIGINDLLTNLRLVFESF